jgi:hypothetical protein
MQVMESAEVDPISMWPGESRRKKRRIPDTEGKSQRAL